jgi:predicted metal-dependent peptidase
MKSNFEIEANKLYEKANEIIDIFFKTNYRDTNIPTDFKKQFFELVDKVNSRLMEDKENFYGYFLFQMDREINFNISSPTAVNFKGARYVIYFNPIIFLNLNLKQMESTIKHEILHIISMHLIRAKGLNKKYKKLVVNMAMDIVVNTFLDNLPPYATTIEWVNFKYDLKLSPFESFEYYVEKLQNTLEIIEDIETEDPTYDSDKEDKIEREFDPNNTHDIWEKSSEIDEKTLKEFTEKFVDNSIKGQVPEYINEMLLAIKNKDGELPWNLYLKRLIGTVESNNKKTTTRLSRRQPNRLDLRGEIRSHKANIAVAIDISGSISDEEFYAAIKEVVSIIKNYNHEITIIECDEEIRRIYKIKSERDIKERLKIRGGTSYSPVFEFANKNKFNLLIYFTDGKGEERLKIAPKGYKILWIISGRGEKLSLKNPYGVIKKLKNTKTNDDFPDIYENIRSGFSMMNQEAERI